MLHHCCVSPLLRRTTPLRRLTTAAAHHCCGCTAFPLFLGGRASYGLGDAPVAETSQQGKANGQTSYYLLCVCVITEKAAQHWAGTSLGAQ